MQYHAHQRNPDRDVALSCDLLTDVHPVKWLLASPTERELSDDQRHCLLFPIPIAHIAAFAGKLHTCVCRTSATLNMNFSAPSRRAMTALSLMNTVRALFLGCAMRAKITPKVIASSSCPKMTSNATSHALSQQSRGLLPPYPAEQDHVAPLCALQDHAHRRSYS